MWIREAGYQDNMVGSNGFKEKNKFNTVSCKICKKFKISNSFERIEKDEDIIIGKIKFDRMLHGKIHDDRISHKPILE